MRPLPILAVAALVLAACAPNSQGPAVAPPAAPALEAPAFERTDYADLDTWLCHPGKTANDACAADLTATIIEEDGSTRIETFTHAADPAFDCFYLYPTVSRDETWNSDLVPGAEELSVIAQQFARYGARCRLYAPMYRQATLLALQTATLTGVVNADAEMRWADISDSWNHYLDHHNEGRGVILIGHSQGAGMVTQLLKREIIGTPAEDLLIAAHPIGSTVHLDADGTFGGLPVCSAAGQARCLVAYVSFRADAEPPATSRFGRVADDGRRAICTNPSWLWDGGTALNAYMPRQNFVRTSEDEAVNSYGVAFDTPFVKLPGLLTAECLSNDTHDWLAIAVNAGPGPRTDTIPGDVVLSGQLLADWGLHLVDMNIAIGNLVGMAQLQGQQWLAERDSGE